MERKFLATLADGGWGGVVTGRAVRVLGEQSEKALV